MAEWYNYLNLISLWYKLMFWFVCVVFDRPIKKIQGLTREIVVAVTTNIESQEFRRRYGEEKGLSPEHPRASTSCLAPCLMRRLSTMPCLRLCLNTQRSVIQSCLSFTTLEWMKGTILAFFHPSTSHQGKQNALMWCGFPGELIQVCLS